MTNIKILLVVLFLVLITAVVFFLTRGGSTPGQRLPLPFFNKPSPSAQTQPDQNQKPFSIISSSPVNNQKDVPTGEIAITLESDQEILSLASFNLEVSPTLPFYWKILDQFPAKKIVAQVYGGLKPSTSYTVTLKDSFGATVSTLTFTTAPQEPSSATGYEIAVEEENNQKYYPLTPYLPYSTPSFDMDYTNKLTLTVEVKSGDINTIKAAVESWIQSHGVDPKTHTINYSNK